MAALVSNWLPIGKEVVFGLQVAVVEGRGMSTSLHFLSLLTTTNSVERVT